MIYYHNLDSIGFADMKYYDGRDNDNLFPSVLANKMKLANLKYKYFAYFHELKGI